MPTIFEIFGLRFFFFADDHMTKGGDDIKIAIEPKIELVYNHGMKVKDVKRALKLAEMYKKEIVEVWYKYHDE